MTVDPSQKAALGISLPKHSIIPNAFFISLDSILYPIINKIILTSPPKNKVP